MPAGEGVGGATTDFGIVIAFTGMLGSAYLFHENVDRRGGRGGGGTDVLHGLCVMTIYPTSRPCNAGREQVRD